MLLRAFIAAIWMTILLASSQMWMKTATQHQVVVVAQPRADTTSVLDESRKMPIPRERDWAEPRVDLNGNEIDDAVGDYRVDRRGEMYERHAPDTALLHLGASVL